MENKNPKKTSLGLNENIEALLCYLLTWVTGIIFLLLDKENRFVKFHAIQSIVVFVPLFILSYVAGMIPFIGGLLSFLLWVLKLILWVLLMVKAYRGELYKVPVAGEIAEQQLNK